MTDAAQSGRRMAAAELYEIAPSLRGYADDVLLGDVWERPGLGKRDRSLVTVAALVAQGRDGVLKRHVGRAIENGVDAGEIVELATHLAFYAGWPAAVGAIQSIRDVLASRGVEEAEVASATIDHPPSLAGARAVPEHAGSPLDFFAFDDFTERVLLADLWKRRTLWPRDRSLCTLAALITAGDLSDLVAHAERGLGNGLKPGEIAEAVTHLAFYAGWPKAAAAAAMLKAWRPEIRDGGS